jgi:aspartyl-tRNA(Asn)/glutamyl-tRNA(Gln) amidotransferase subunit C
MPELSRDQVEAVAALANLDLDDAEIETFRRQLSDILHYAGELQRIDTTGVPPTASVSARETADRPDAVSPSLSRQDALANAPEGTPEVGLFKVPRVIG